MTSPVGNTARAVDQNRNGLTLLVVARDRHPTVAWWWGRRQTDTGDVAQCYVCDQEIARWDGRLSTWPPAAAAIDTHREAHLAEMRAESTPPEG